MLFFFNDTATTEIYTLSLHDALPICARHVALVDPDLDPDPAEGGLSLVEAVVDVRAQGVQRHPTLAIDRKSTRLNSSHANISYAVFCLKKKTSNSSLQTSSLHSLHSF